MIDTTFEASWLVIALFVIDLVVRSGEVADPPVGAHGERVDHAEAADVGAGDDRIDESAVRSGSGVTEGDVGVHDRGDGIRPRDLARHPDDRRGDVLDLGVGVGGGQVDPEGAERPPRRERDEGEAGSGRATEQVGDEGEELGGGAGADDR